MALLLTSAAPPSPVPAGLRCLKEAYPEHVCKVEATSLTMCDGTVLPWDDGKRKASHDERLDRPDLEDMMAQRYPLGPAWTPPPARDVDPGRIRVEALFQKMYGASAKEVRRTLVPVTWLGGKAVTLTRVNGAADALRRVAKELAKLPAPVQTIAQKTSGTFNWRKIRGASRMSMHSYGIAIDVGVPFADYWRWRKARPDGSRPYRNRFPVELVEAFERHGFIWGGKWYHFDTMHFEYRPELLAEGCVKR